MNNNQPYTKANDKLPGQQLETSKVMELVFNDAHELPEVQIDLQEDKIIIKPVKNIDPATADNDNAEKYMCGI